GRGGDRGGRAGHAGAANAGAASAGAASAGADSAGADSALEGAAWRPVRVADQGNHSLSRTGLPAGGRTAPVRNGPLLHTGRSERGFTSSGDGLVAVRPLGCRGAD